MTLNQYIKLFTDISTAHKQVKYFGNGAIHEYLDTNVNTELGAHLWLEIDKSNITKGVLVDSFTLYCMDYVNKDITNRNDVLSDTKRILEDVIALLYNPVYADLFELDENNQLDVFYDEQNAGEACGWKTNISLKQDFLYDSCQIPLDGIPVGEGGYVVPTSWSPALYIPLTGLASPTSTSIGYIPNVYYMRQNSGYTLNSTTGVQKLFNGTANGRVTLPVGIYHITAQIYLTSMDTGTSGNASFSLVSGSGTATNFIMDCYGADASPITGTGNRTGSGATTNAFPSPNMLTATTAARMIVTVNGSFEVTGAGTFIPSIALTSAASAVSDIGTMIKIECVGVTGTPYAGAWD